MSEPLDVSVPVKAESVATVTPPTVAVVEDASRRDETLDLVSLGANSHLDARTDLDLQLEYGGEDMTVRDVSDDVVVVRNFDGRLHEFGGQGKLHRELGAGWSVDVGAGHSQRPAESIDTGVDFTFAPDRTTFARLDCRWRGPRCSAGADARVEHRTSDALTSQGDLATFGLSFSGALADVLTLAARALGWHDEARRFSTGSILFILTRFWQ